MRSIVHTLKSLLEHPVKLGILALGLAFACLLVEGTFFDLWNLKAEKRRLEGRYEVAEKYNSALKFRINQARTSDKFIGRQAREKLDLLKDDELVFIFESDISSEKAKVSSF